MGASFLVGKIVQRHTDHDRQHTLIRHSLEPFLNTSLVDSRSKVTRTEHKNRLSTGFLALRDLLKSVLDVLRCGAGYDRPVLVPGIIECLPLALDELVALFARDVDGFACGS